MFVHSDPAHSGFKPLADDHRMPVDELIAARATFFPEGAQVSGSFLSHLVTERKQFYEDKRELRQIFRIGVVFFIGTCLADFLVCSI